MAWNPSVIGQLQQHTYVIVDEHVCRMIYDVLTTN